MLQRELLGKSESRVWLWGRGKTIRGGKITFGRGGIYFREKEGIQRRGAGLLRSTEQKGREPILEGMESGTGNNLLVKSP